jgi:hypothetical protein
MERYFTKTFFRFFFGFVVIIGVAFVVLAVASSWRTQATPVDNVALPQ